MLDVAGGIAVHARAGERSRYRPVVSTLAPAAAGDPLALLQAYRDDLGARECYLADLDAIEGGPPQAALLRRLAERAAPCGLLVDAGASRPEDVAGLLAAGARSAVVGLETLRSFDDLAASVASSGAERIVFSLDLRHGRPVVGPDQPPALAGAGALSLAERAVGAGVTTLLLLDVGRVGSGAGVDVELLRALRSGFPDLRLLAGGGVAGGDDLARLRDAGCDGALVATALHGGAIGPGDVSRGRAPLGRSPTDRSSPRPPAPAT